MNINYLDGTAKVGKVGEMIPNIVYITKYGKYC